MNENAARHFRRIIVTVEIASAGAITSSFVMMAVVPVANADETPATISQTDTPGDVITAPGSVVVTGPVNDSPVRVVPTEPVRVVPIEPVRVVPTEPVRVVPTEPVRVVPTGPVTTSPTQPVTTLPTEPVKVAPTEPVKVAPTEPRTPTAPTEPVTGPASPTSPVSGDTGTATAPLQPVIITPPPNADVDSASLFPFLSGVGSSDDADQIGWYHLPGWGAEEGGTFTPYLFRTGTDSNDTSGISSIWGTAKVDENASPFSTDYAALTSGGVAVDPKTGDPLLVNSTGPNEPGNWVTGPSARWDELNIHPLGLQLFQHDSLSWPAMVAGSSTGGTIQGLSQTLDTFLFNPFGHVLFGVEYGDTANGQVLDLIGPDGTVIPIMGGGFGGTAADVAGAALSDGGVAGILGHLLGSL